MWDDDRNTFGWLTPSGRGGIATMVCAGPKSEGMLRDLFRPVVDTMRGLPHLRPVFGRWPLPDFPSASEEVVVVKIDRSCYEVHHHGGMAVQRALRHQLQQMGFEEASGLPRWDCDEVDAICHASLALLPAVLTRRGASVLLDQYHGALRRAVDAVRSSIHANQVETALQDLGTLCRRSEFGLRLDVPWRVVLTGAPNVGKSSLLNRMLGYQRAIVAEEAGTTRDAIAGLTAIDGWPVLLTDTAGLRSNPHDPLEALGIVTARRELHRANVIVQVRAWGGADYEIIAGESGPVVHVANKADLRDGSSEPPPRSDELSVCALNGEGLDRLLTCISHRLGTSPPRPGDAVPFLPEQVAALRDAIAALERHDTLAACAILDRI